MKFNPIYLYGVIFLAVVTYLIIISDSTPRKESVKEIFTNDQNSANNFNKNFGIQEQNPNSANVSKEVFEKLKKMKILADAKPADILRRREYADFLFASHRPDDAIKYYEKILSIDKNRKDIYLVLTLIYYNQLKLDKAEKITNKILKLSPNDVMATYNLGAIEATKGNIDKAREIWKSLSFQILLMRLLS